MAARQQQEKEVLSLVKSILSQANIRKNISSVRELNSSFFTLLYNKLPAITGQLTPLGVNERIRCQLIINSLKRLLPPEVSLSHISGHDIAKGDLLSIKNLLEIFAVLLELPVLSDDSNLLSGEGLKVVNEVLKEELVSPPSVIHIPTAVDSTQFSIATPPVSVERSTHSTPVTPPTHRVLTSPLDQSTPHKGPKSRIDVNNEESTKLTPPLSVSSLSTTPTADVSRPLATQSVDSSSSSDTVVKDSSSLTSDELGEERKEREEEEERSLSSPVRECNTIKDHSVIVKRLYQNYISSHQKPLKMKGKHSIPSVSLPTPSGVAVTSRQPSSSGKMLKTIVQESFPALHISPATERRLWQQEMRQLKAQSMSRPLVNSTQRKIEDMKIRRKALLDILRKELNHSNRMHTLSIKRQQEKALKLSLQNQRQVVARSRRYYNDYELSIQKKLQRQRTKDELIFKRTFEECLKMQRQNKEELKRYAKEKEQLATKKHHDKLESLQSFYENQLALIAETIEIEQKATEDREKEQHKESKKSQYLLRKQMEEEIKELWSGIDNWEEDNVHFRECDSELLKDRLTKQLK